MKDLLFVKALYLPVFATQKLDSKSDEKWEFEHQKVCGFIQKFVKENVYNHIDQETYARTLWEKLESLYASKSGNNKLFLLKKMMALKYKEGTSIADHGIITLDLAKSGVLNEDVRRRSQGSTSQSEVLVTENRVRNREKDCHIKKYCFKLKRENKGGGDKHDRNDKEKSEFATVTREDLLVICDENLVNLACDETSWVIDTGASIHVMSRRDFFTSYTPGRLDGEGFCNTFSDGQWKLTKGSLVVARGKKSSNLYLMQASTSRDIVNVTMNDSSTELWHKRLSHMSEKGLNCLAKKNQLSGLKNATLKNCPHCLAGKQRRVSFKSCHTHRKSELLELVYLDVCGPIKDQTIDDIDKTEKEDSPDSGDLTDVNPVPIDPSPNPIQDDVHGDVNDDQQDIGDFDAPIDDVVTDQQQAPIAPPTVPLRRSSRDRRSSVRDYWERKNIGCASVLVPIVRFLP
ncbi:hypothetical protein V6N12_024477 [Hibiscus sabdariffa]|uniref:GAG-pre-integrase domain-containing protein n=1 Tax=Hibiscus sabdariffa TaxID=183260 RepID=A0ABR2G0N9_9ROSI